MPHLVSDSLLLEVSVLVPDLAMVSGPLDSIPEADSSPERLRRAPLLPLLMAASDDGCLKMPAYHFIVLASCPPL